MFQERWNTAESYSGIFAGKLIILKLFILETVWNFNKQGFNTAALDTNTSAR